MPIPLIRPLARADEPSAERLLDLEFAGRWQARMGKLHDVLALPGFVAELHGEITGLATPCGSTSGAGSGSARCGPVRSTRHGR